MIEVIQKDKPEHSFIFVGSRFESLHVTTNPRVTKEMWRYKRSYWGGKEEKGALERETAGHGCCEGAWGGKQEGNVTREKEESLIMRGREER